MPCYFRGVILILYRNSVVKSQGDLITEFINNPCGDDRGKENSIASIKDVVGDTLTYAATQKINYHGMLICSLENVTPNRVQGRLAPRHCGSSENTNSNSGAAMLMADYRWGDNACNSCAPCSIMHNARNTSSLSSSIRLSSSIITITQFTHHR